MRWKKMGLIYGPDGDSEWARHSALQPTPLLKHEEGLIRVFVGLRDDKGVSRIGFVDLNAENPSQVLGVSTQPALDTGIPGTFDENGVVPCSIVEREGKLYLYYAGYQLGQKVKFYVFSGLAVSDDGGKTFTRFSRVPICDRTDDELFFRVIHTMMYDNGMWRAWYGAGDEYILRDGKQLPTYNIRYAEARDGVELSRDYKICIDPSGEEYRVGRPYVIKHDGRYKMFYSAGTAARGYRLAYAESDDGISWRRMDAEMGIDVSPTGWDSQMQLAATVLMYKENVYLFYNGNNFGQEGFGYAKLESW